MFGEKDGLPFRQALYFAYHRANGRPLGRIYRQLLDADRSRFSSEAAVDGLRPLLHHAASSVPYYAASLRGLEREIDADPVEVLRTLPPLTKDTIRTRPEHLYANDIDQRRIYEQTSGGSTGEPVRLVQDSRFRDIELAGGMLYSSWTGWRFGEPEIWIWGSERDILNGNSGMRGRIANRLVGRRYFNAFRLTPESMKECLEQLNGKPPKLIVAYAHTLDDLAAFARDEGISVVPQQAIISTASTLHPVMRDRIESVFGCRIFNQYGSREVGDIAGECDQHRGLHVLPWMNFVEILDEDGELVAPGEVGRVLVTSLTNYAMPLIRYELGDRARLMPQDEPLCPCGRGGLRLAEVVGRTGDTFKAIDGSHVASGYFIHMLFFRDFVKRFQVIQKEPSRVVYRLVTESAPPQHALDEIARDTRAAMGNACEVEFEFPAELSPSPSGKYRYTISEC